MKGKKESQVIECETISYRKHYFPWHLHPNVFSFCLTIDGKAELIFKDQTFTTTEGDIILIPPYAPHQTVIDDFYIYKIIRVTVAHNNWSNWDDLRVYILRDPQAIADFNNWYQLLKARRPVAVSTLALGYLPKQLWPFDPKEDSSISTQVTPLVKVLAYIHENFTEPIYLNELSKVATLSSSHFQRLFKQQFAISPMRYIQSLRIEKAKELIKEGNPMTEVAYATGFYDQSHFNKYFKMLAGMIPKKYSAIVQND